MSRSPGLWANPGRSTASWFCATSVSTHWGPRATGVMKRHSSLPIVHGSWEVEDGMFILQCGMDRRCGCRAADGCAGRSTKHLQVRESLGEVQNCPEESGEVRDPGSKGL
eukprot:gene15770-biopygen1158